MATLFRNAIIKFPITNDADCLLIEYGDEWKISKIIYENEYSRIDILSPKYNEYAIIETFEQINECDISFEQREDIFYFIHDDKNIVEINERGFIESICKRSQIIVQKEEAL